jgi:hypothetical protein
MLVGTTIHALMSRKGKLATPRQYAELKGLAYTKTPLIILSALALLAGCKSSLSKTETRAETKTETRAAPDVAYLRFNEDSVLHVKWTQTGPRLEGTFEAWDRKPEGEIELTLFRLNGVLDGENVSMTLNPVKTSRGASRDLEGTITGTLKGDALTLPPVKGAAPVELRRASLDEFLDAYRNLQKRTKTKKTNK